MHSALDYSPLAPPLDHPSAVALTAAVKGRVLLVSELYPPDVGGSAVLLHETYSRLSGNQLTVVADQSRHRTGASIAGAPLVAAPIQTSRWGILDPRALAHHLRLAVRLRALGSRETVIHCARALPEGVAALAARLMGGPRYVCWTHGEDVTSALSSRELSFVMRGVYRGASAVVANSENTRRLLESIGVPVKKIHVVHPGVDADRFNPGVDGAAVRERVAPGASFVLLSVGRFQRRKGHDTVLQALPAIKPQLPGLRYVIVGDGDERARLQNMAQALGVADVVVFAGEVPAADLPSYFAACDLFVLPNRIEQGDIEGFGIVFLEAAATGRAVIGGNTGGVPEAVADGETGILVSGTDAAELASAILRLARDRDLRSRMGDAGRARVAARFSWDAASRRIRTVHENVLAR